MDIDIDFLDRKMALEKFKHIAASRTTDNGLVPHNTGIYVHSIPHDPITNLSTIEYKTAENRGYFKIDFLNVHVYNGVKDNDHLTKLMETEPIWDLLKQDEFVNLLFHLNGHGDILRQTLPTSVEQLAAILSMIRPAKRYLIGKDWTTIMNEVWIKPDTGDEGYYWKKSHAFSYAFAVIVHMNLICDELFRFTDKSN
jgi:hypothetical protein